MKPEDLGTYYESILDQEARREGGIYYTPPLIVDYMADNALGGLLESKKPEEAAGVKIVDPACGGGVFLLSRNAKILKHPANACFAGKVAAFFWKTSGHQ